MLAYYFVPFMSVIVTFYSEFQTVKTPWPSKIGHMFIWTFLITKTSYALKSWNTLYNCSNCGDTFNLIRKRNVIPYMNLWK